MHSVFHSCQKVPAMYRAMPPPVCHSCGENVPRAAAHRCPLCLFPFAWAGTPPRPSQPGHPARKEGDNDKG